MGHFFPVAVLTASIELVLPLALWVYTLMDRRWEIFERDTRSVNTRRHTPTQLPPSGNRQRKRNRPRNAATNAKKLNGSNHPNQHKGE